MPNHYELECLKCMATYVLLENHVCTKCRCRGRYCSFLNGKTSCNVEFCASQSTTCESLCDPPCQEDYQCVVTNNDGDLPFKDLVGTCWPVNWCTSFPYDTSLWACPVSDEVDGFWLPDCEAVEILANRCSMPIVWTIIWEWVVHGTGHTIL